MTRAVLSLGANVGDARAALAAAVTALDARTIRASAVYRTPPWGPVPQDDFFNQTLIVDDDTRDAVGWLQECRRLESAAGRERNIRWGPRTLDADVIAVWSDGSPVFSADPDLTLPHPRAAERAFVLVPWLELDQEADLPGAGRVDALLATLDPADVERIKRVPDGH